MDVQPGANYERKVGKVLETVGGFGASRTTRLRLVELRLPLTRSSSPILVADQYWQSPYTIVNAGVGLRTDDKRYALELWVKNLFDTRYIAPNGSWTQGTATAPASTPFRRNRVTSASLSARNSTAKHSPARRRRDGFTEHEIAFSSAATPVDRHLCGPQSRLWLGEPYGEGRPRGGQVGYLYQFSPLIVAGVEADIEGTGVSTGGHGYAQPGRSLDYDVSFRGRVA